MSKKPKAGKTIRRTLADVRAHARSADDEQRLDRAVREPIDFSDSPEHLRGWPQTDVERAIIDELLSRGITVAQLWQVARKFSPKLTEPAIKQFLGGKEQIAARDVDALLKALGLRIVTSRVAG